MIKIPWYLDSLQNGRRFECNGGMVCNNGIYKIKFKIVMDILFKLNYVKIEKIYKNFGVSLLDSYTCACCFEVMVGIQ